VNEQLPIDKQEEDVTAVTQPAEEILVADPRGEMTPSQFVERKLVALLGAKALPVSQVHSDRYTGR
jgi:hypothetical protein